MENDIMPTQIPSHVESNLEDLAADVRILVELVNYIGLCANESFSFASGCDSSGICSPEQCH
ncbi:MAG: hypothetical protein IT291_07090 [Deltaproteobacteria bacterium]|nr:hypothetical protein [Deltaproteobacteria bacterium]